MANDYRTMPEEDMAEFFGTVSRQRVQQILKRFEDSGDQATVDRIKRAKVLLKARKYKEKTGVSVEDGDRVQGIWSGILLRCGKAKAYLDCTVQWKSGDEFKRWAVQQVGFKTEGFELDKDILVKGNRVYGPDLCVFVPLEINSLFSGCYKAKKRGTYPIGVCFNKGSGSFVAQMNDRQSNGLDKYLGSFPTVEEAFACYKAAKEAKMRRLAQKWKDHIDPRAYAALMARAVEWDD